MKPLITAATIALATATPAVAEQARNARIQDVFTVRAPRGTIMVQLLVQSLVVLLALTERHKSQVV